jgi:thiol-disulfide isomerase/thioredoxin
VQAGEVIENLELATLDGDPYELKTVRRGSARAVVLYVTATWCFSCRPAVDWINQKVASSGGSVAAIAAVVENKQFEPADAATGREFADGYGVKFLTVIDSSRKLDKYRASGVIPTTIVIDPATMRITYKEFTFNAVSLDSAIAKLTAPATGS